MTVGENGQEIVSSPLAEGHLAKDKTGLSDLWSLLGIGFGLALTVAWSASLLGLFLFLII